MNFADMRASFRGFWGKYPALFYGFAGLLSAGVALFFHWIYLACLILLLLSNSFKKSLVGALYSLVVFLYAHSYHTFPQLPEGKKEVAGKYCIQSLSLQSSPFHRSFLYQGILKTEEGNIPCRLYIPSKKTRIEATHDLWIQGTLVQKGDKQYVLKNYEFQPVEKSYSYAELRFKLKDRFKTYLKEKIPDRKVATFLLSMITGEIEEKLLSYQFNKLGLQHILGVSGFQFVLLAGFFGFLLRMIFPYKIATIILLLGLGAYFFILGDSPPVFRAFVMIGIVLIGRLCNRKTTALNALGVSLILHIGIDPLVIGHLGFQLSYLCTGAILFLYSPMRAMVGKILPLRSISDIRKMRLWDQHGYIASYLIRETAAVNLAVHLMATPLLLFYFHKFSLMSFIYNLFFPLGAAFVFLLLLIALTISLLLPPLGAVVYMIDGKLTAALLHVAAYPPISLDICIRTKTVPLEGVVLWICILTFLMPAGASCSDAARDT